MYVYISRTSTTHFEFILNMLKKCHAIYLVVAGAMQTPMDVASSDGGTDNEVTRMRTAEEEEKRLEDEYKAEEKEQETKETKKKSILDALRERYSEYIPPIKL